MTRKSSLRMSIVAIVAMLALTLTAAPAFAQGPGGGGGGKGGGGGETTANNLSVPAIIIGAGAPTLKFPCGAAVDPTGTPLTGYPIDPNAYYYVQGIHTWQASCDSTQTSATVDANWGDNLIGEAKLKTNSPIRVEMGLLATNPTSFNMTGWTVDKLDPNALDRVSAYGTKASGSTETGFTSNPVTPYGEVRVWVVGAALTITNPSNVTSTLNAAAEINSTGRIVYGYNLRVTTAGVYTLHFTVPSSITVNSSNGTAVGGTVVKNADGSTTISLPITVVSNASGGGGGGQGKGHNK
jgi:hypothetical protein